MALDSSRLFQAIKANKVEDMRYLLTTNVGKQNTALRRRDGSSLLHAVIQRKASPVILELLLKHVDFTLRDVKGNSFADLMFAGDYTEEGESVLTHHIRSCLMEGDVVKSEGWLQRGWNIWPINIPQAKLVSQGLIYFVEGLPEFQKNVLNFHSAIHEGDIKEIKQSMKDKRLLLAADRTGLPPLHKAIMWEKKEIAQELFSKQPEAINFQDHMGRTPLHYAAGIPAMSDLYSAMKEAGADDDLTDVAGYTADSYQANPSLLNITKIRINLQETMNKPVITSRRKEPTVPARYKKPYITPVLGPRGNVAPPSTIDGKYAAEHVGAALTLALAEIVEVRPEDPIEYLALWLYKHHDNTNYRKKQLLESKYLREEEEKWERDSEVRRKIQKELREFQAEERRRLEQEEADRQKREQEEAQRKAKEAALQLAQRPSLETLTEEEGEDDAARGIVKDFYGQTELHKLAITPGADLLSLLNQGHSLAERNGENKTPREVAVEKQLQEHVDTIDQFIISLINKEKFDQLEQLLLDGYDQWEPVLQTFQDTDLSEGVTKFISSIPEYQESMKKVLLAAHEGNIDDIRQSLERKKLALARDSAGRSALHIAVLTGQSPAVEYLITYFPEIIKSKDNLNRTALHYAMALSENLTQLLLDKGADDRAKDAKQKSVYYYKDNPEEIRAMQKPQHTEEVSAEDSETE